MDLTIDGSMITPLETEENGVSLEKELKQILKDGCPLMDSCNYPITFGYFVDKIDHIRNYCGNGKRDECPAVKPVEKKNEQQVKRSLFRAVYDNYKRILGTYR